MPACLGSEQAVPQRQGLLAVFAWERSAVDAQQRAAGSISLADGVHQLAKGGGPPPAFRADEHDRM
jgi:hypothetical protein